MNSIRLSPVVKAWIATLVTVFLVGQFVEKFLGFNFMGTFGLVPRGVVLDHRFWQLFTYPFLHADLTHLLLNSLMLAFLGSELELLWGPKRFVTFAAISAFSGGLFYLLLQIFVWGAQSLSTPMVGASGAIYGLLVAYGILFSERTLLFMMLFPLKAKHFVWVLAAVEFFTTVFSGRGGLGAASHLGGMAAGIVTLWIWARQRRQSGRGPLAGVNGASKSRPSHLKLVVNQERPPRDAKRGDDNGPTFH